jgi:tryptophanyl-tRNA synthetase
MGWGHAKQELFEIVNEVLTPIRERYNQLLEDKALIDKILDEGSAKAREFASEKMIKIKKAIGVGY